MKTMEFLTTVLGQITGSELIKETSSFLPTPFFFVNQNISVLSKGGASNFKINVCFALQLF